MYALLRPLLFALPAEDAHAMAMGCLQALDALAPLRDLTRRLFPLPAGLETRRLGLTFPSPIGIAGGFDKDAHVPRSLAALGFGFVELGTVTALAQEANPAPHLFRLPDDRALINRLGFPNDGAEAVAARFERLGGRAAVGVPVAISIGKSRVVPLEPFEPVVEDYRVSFRAVRASADFVVVNVSSPNTKNLRALQGEGLARTLLGALVRENERSGRRVPLLLKVSPDLGAADLGALLDVVHDVKLDGVVATNTTLARSGLQSPSGRVEAAGAGGLSGPPLRARALQIVRDARTRLGPDATIVGVGGIETGADAHAYLEAGADLVQLYTSFVYDGPAAPTRIARELLALRSFRDAVRPT